MEALSQLRTLIASLDKELVECLVTRAHLQRNDHLYTNTGGTVQERDAMAAQFADSSTLAARVQVLRPAYLQHWRPLICEPGENGERTPCMAADTACLDALARRLALSVHVATHKREAIPDTLHAAIKSGGAAQVEEAITHPEVEVEVLARIRARALAEGAKDPTPRQIAALYEDWIIPLSRKIQVHGLLADSESTGASVYGCLSALPEGIQEKI